MAPRPARGEDGAEARHIVVRSTARLHLGFLDLNGGLGRRFGSLGMALDGPETHLSLRFAPHSLVTGAETTRAERYLSRLEAALNLPQRHALHVSDAIPAHAGLGSGTQLALSIATALRGLHHLDPDPRGDAALLGRGGRSGIGIALFQSGGFVLDGGRGPSDRPPPVLTRLPVPADWRVILVRDDSFQGVSGTAENEAFAALPPMPAERADRLCRLTLIQVLPALAEADLLRFGSAVTEIQQLVGQHFAPVQGGYFASSAVAAVIEQLSAAGAVGAGQTSWGPTGFAFAATSAEAERLAQVVMHFPGAAKTRLSIHRPLNRGAVIAPAE